MTNPKPFPLESHLPPEQLPGLGFRIFQTYQKHGIPVYVRSHYSIPLDTSFEYEYR